MMKKLTHETTVHGITLCDDYHWLRERGNPEVIAYLEEENRRTEQAMAHTTDLQRTLFEEFKSRLLETDLSVPVPHGGFLYYSRTEEGRQYPLYFRRPDRPDGREQLLLDLNDFACDSKYLRLGVLELSPDHRLLAFSLDLDGSEEYTIRFREIDSGQDLPDRIEKSYDTLAWAADCRTVFYTVLDEAKRPYRVLQHRLGQPSATDTIVFQEADERFFVGVGKSKSERYVVISLESKITSEIHLIDAKHPDAAPQVFWPREQGVEYSLAHHTDRFFVLTNKHAKNFRLLEIAEEAIPGGVGAANELIAHSAEDKLDAIEAFREHLVIYGRSRGLRTIRVLELASGNEREIAFDEEVYTACGASNPEFDSTTLRYHYTSLVTPPSVYEIDLGSFKRRLLKRKEVLGNYDPSRYHSRREWACAEDGTRIPISLIYRDDFERDGRRPCLLYGYGAYGISIDPGFSLERLSLLDRGFVYAIAHVRGGGELGRAWYEAGKLREKKNSFTDFIACAEHLVREKYTTPSRLAAMGGSAGGLLMGAVLNLRPDLFAVVEAQVPFVDVVNTMLDETLPLTVIEYEEWGDPRQREDFEYMLSYSPYDQVKRKDYPHLLITAGLNDPRVQYWEPAKWAAKLREMKSDDHLLLLKTEMASGHAGSSGRYDRMHERAFEYAFLLDRLSINE